MAETLLEIENLHVEVDGKKIIKGLTFSMKQGEVHALMGRNGSGKSTLSAVLMGHPKYVVTQGTIRLRGEDILTLTPDERAKRGLFLAFQYPIAVPGVTVANFLREATRQIHGEEFATKKFRKAVKEKLTTLGINETFMTRYVNDGFSGGEKKRLEVLQLMLLNPALSVLDETDSGLDVDALKLVATAVNTLRDDKHGFLIITHYQRMLEYIRPDVVHILVDGAVVKRGDATLAEQLDKVGYDALVSPVGPA